MLYILTDIAVRDIMSLDRKNPPDAHQEEIVSLSVLYYVLWWMSRKESTMARPFIKLFTQKGGLAYLNIKDMKAEEMRIFLYMLMYNSHGFCCDTQKEIADKLEMQQSNVSRAIKALVQGGFIIMPKRCVYMISEQWAHYGE